MDNSDIRIAALQIISSRYQHEHNSPEELIAAAEKLAGYAMCPDHTAVERAAILHVRKEIERTSIGTAMKEMAHKSGDRPHIVHGRNAEDLEQPGAVVEPPHMTRPRPILPPELDKPDAELCEGDIMQRDAIRHEQDVFDGEHTSFMPGLSDRP